MNKYILLFLISINISYISSDEINDPFEDINRVTHNINDTLDNAIAKPVLFFRESLTISRYLLSKILKGNCPPGSIMLFNGKIGISLKL